MAWTEEHTRAMKNLYGWLNGKTQEQVKDTLQLYLDNFSNTDEYYLMRGIRAEKELSLQSNPPAPSIQKIRSRIREITESEVKEKNQQRMMDRQETPDSEVYYDVYTDEEKYENIKERTYAMNLGDNLNGTVYRMYPDESKWKWECLRRGNTQFEKNLPDHLKHVVHDEGESGELGWKGVHDDLKSYWFDKYPWLSNTTLSNPKTFTKTIQSATNKVAEETLRF